MFEGLPTPPPCDELEHFAALGIHWHYPTWLLLGDAVARCECGRHERRISVDGVLRAWHEGHGGLVYRGPAAA